MLVMRDRRTITSKATRSWLLPYFLLLLIALPGLIIYLDVYPVAWFDEGFITNTARTFAMRGVFGTYTTEGINPFNPALTTGIPIILPVSFVFKLFGIGILQARLVATFYALLGLISLYSVAVYLFGRIEGLFIALIFLLLPSIAEAGYILMGRLILGEVALFAFTMLGLRTWFHSWEKDSQLWSYLSGVVFGFGLIAKTQGAFAVLPALAIIGFVRGRRKNIRELLQFMSPFIIATMFTAGWILIQRAGYSHQLRESNHFILREAVKILIFPGFWQRSLNTGATVIIILMALAVLSTTWRLSRSYSKGQVIHNQDWGEITLSLIVLFGGIWFGLLSIGYPRYANLPLMVSYILLAKFGWDLLQTVINKTKFAGMMEKKYYQRILFAGLSFIALLANVVPLMFHDKDTSTQEVANFIASEIPRDAVIESWEWQVDAFSNHWTYHHPDQIYLMIATRQLFLEDGVFDLEYDVLQSDPDYLLKGIFSNWTGIYDEDVIAREFRSLATFKPYDYEILERIRD